MNLVIINDLHLGVHRNAGTTPTTAAALKDWGLQQYKLLLEKAADTLGGSGHLVVNGDLTDRFDIALADALNIYSITLEFLQAYPEVHLTWALGNHDLSKDSSKLGTVTFLSYLLAPLPNFKVVHEPSFPKGDGVYIIPHLVNQDAFDEALDNVPTEAKVVLLHCNFDNGFAAQADHSLNLSREQAKRLTQAGKLVVLGHEHQGRSAFGGKVIVLGNQFPTSIADCLTKGEAQEDGNKYMLHVTNDGAKQIVTWKGKEQFIDVYWKDALEKTPAGVKFVRVSGEATAEEAPDAVRIVSELRKTHDAFIITNAVRVENLDDDAEITVAVEDIGKIDVISLLKEFLTDEQAEKITKLMHEVGSA